MRIWNVAAALTLVGSLVLGQSPAAHAQEKDLVDTAVAAGSFKTLAAALGAGGLVDALKGEGPFTVFAPTDEAFAKLPAGTVESLLKPENKDKLVGILTYHVVKGAVPAKQVVTLSGANTLNGQRVDIKVADGTVTVDKAKVVKTDIKCSNGIIHVIDSVILPEAGTIPAVATKAGTFNTLLAAAKAAGLVEALSGKGPLTVFAPTDDAFAKLPKGTVESLLEPGNKGKLAAILKYHVVSGRVYSPEAVEAGAAKTLQGAALTIKVADGVAKVNDAKLLATDIDAANGVIHVIDSVLLPPNGQQSQAARPTDMLANAVRHGAPLYNAGHHAACANLYMETLQTVLSSHGEQMSPSISHSVHTALTHARGTSCATTRAWTLRRAIDSAYVAMVRSDR